MMSIATLDCHFTVKLFKARSITFANQLPYLPSRTLFNLYRTHASYKITLVKPDGKEYHFDTPANTNILKAAKNVGVPDLPYSCKEGKCGTCIGKLQLGKVDQSKGRLLTNPEKKEYVLTCVSYPRRHCVIHTHKEKEFILKRDNACY